MKCDFWHKNLLWAEPYFLPRTLKGDHSKLFRKLLVRCWKALVISQVSFARSAMQKKLHLNISDLKEVHTDLNKTYTFCLLINFYSSPYSCEHGVLFSDISPYIFSLQAYKQTSASSSMFSEQILKYFLSYFISWFCQKWHTRLIHHTKNKFFANWDMRSRLDI